MVERKERNVDGDKNIHPLDRDYTKMTPKRKWTAFRFKSRSSGLGVVGFGVGLLLLLLGIVIDQFKTPTNDFEDYAVNLREFGSYFILGSGLCVVVGQRMKSSLAHYVSVAIFSPRSLPPISRNLWIATVHARSDLLVEEQANPAGSAALGNVYLLVSGSAIAHLRWIGGEHGAVNVNFYRRDELAVVDRVKEMAHGCGGQVSHVSRNR